MGMTQHDMLIVAPSNTDQFLEMFDGWIEKAIDPEDRYLFAILRNRYGGAFVIMVPDGSKEGWEYSEKCDLIRQSFLLFAQQYHQKHFCRIVQLSFGELPFKATYNCEG